MVAKWMGLKSPISAGRAAIRGYVVYPEGHGFEPKLYAYFGGGVRLGFAPCDDKGIYWFCTFTQSLFKCESLISFPLILIINSYMVWVWHR